MKLQRFKERDNKRIGIIVFTVACILLVSGVILYRTFAIFEVKTNQNIINGQVQSMGDLEFVFYKDDVITKNVPTEKDYAFDSSKSYCIERSTGNQVSNVSWNSNKSTIELNDVSELGKVKCYIYFNKIYQEEELHGAIPDLGNGRLVPITYEINETGPVVKKADITSDWYKYTEQRWANAVILEDEVEDKYKPGDEILESEIESYFVWIPRYEYQIWNGLAETNEYTHIKEDLGNVENTTTNDKLNQAKEIQIKFVNKEDSIQYGMNKEEWVTHPVFTSFNANGFWVGKFETSKNSAAEADSNSPTAVQIKPNVSSWRNINVANAFDTTYKYQRVLDSHMMKNMEWGAIAYLTQSKYGRCSDGTCTKVRINNNSEFITGSSAVNEPTCGYTGESSDCNQWGTSSNIVNSYNNPLSVASSTTNNYYGVYDMAGGTWEYVMGIMQSSEKNASPTSGRSNTYNSGFNGKFTCATCDGGSSQPTELKDGKPWPSSKYYDLYDYSTSNQEYQRGKLGDGTKEFGPFYSVAYQKTSGGTTAKRNVGSYKGNAAFFIYPEYPWLTRGAGYNYGSETGIATFEYNSGSGSSTLTFRVVLTP